MRTGLNNIKAHKAEIRELTVTDTMSVEGIITGGSIVYDEEDTGPTWQDIAAPGPTLEHFDYGITTDLQTIYGDPGLVLKIDGVNSIGDAKETIFKIISSYENGRMTGGVNSLPQFHLRGDIFIDREELTPESTKTFGLVRRSYEGTQSYVYGHLGDGDTEESRPIIGSIINQNKMVLGAGILNDLSALPNESRLEISTIADFTPYVAFNPSEAIPITFHPDGFILQSDTNNFLSCTYGLTSFCSNDGLGTISTTISEAGETYRSTTTGGTTYETTQKADSYEITEGTNATTINATSMEQTDGTNTTTIQADAIELVTGTQTATIEPDIITLLGYSNYITRLTDHSLAITPTPPEVNSMELNVQTGTFNILMDDTDNLEIEGSTTSTRIYPTKVATPLLYAQAATSSVGGYPPALIDLPGTGRIYYNSSTINNKINTREYNYNPLGLLDVPVIMFDFVNTNPEDPLEPVEENRVGVIVEDLKELAPNCVTNSGVSVNTTGMIIQLLSIIQLYAKYFELIRDMLPDLPPLDALCEVPRGQFTIGESLEYRYAAKRTRDIPNIQPRIPKRRPTNAGPTKRLRPSFVKNVTGEY